MNQRLITIFFTLLLLSFFEGRASHIVGGEMTYKFMGDSPSYYRYQVTLSIYEDCLNGQPEAIAQDNPAYFGVYLAAYPFNFIYADSAFYTTSVAVPTNFSNSCISQIPATCLLKKTFVTTFALLPNSTGYVIDYQRCCRNAQIGNVIDPGNHGSTYFCYIPGVVHNNSAVFKNYPPQIICRNNPLIYDNSATDADNDSLSYGFTAALDGADGNNVKPYPPVGPPFDTVAYAGSYSSQYAIPGYPLIHIDPRTGLITGTPNLVGRYLVCVYCNEYRDGIFINTITREFQFVVTDCSKLVVADIPQYSTDPNTYIVDCKDYTVNFVNTSTGGFSYHWDFGVPNSYNDTSTAFEPTYTYPDTGTYTVKLVVNPGSTCPDSIERLVKVYPKFHADFTDSGGQCPGLPVSFVDQSSASIKPITLWKWSFGDGDSTLLENPVHTYRYGGIYNVILISENIKDCADTVMKQVFIDNFVPFAGDDTVIVKGEQIQFDATGGISYLWSPATNLNDTTVYDPVGIYEDTGHFTYSVFVISPYGCQEYDTITVTVVNQAAFVMPNAFTPNGDGLNDFLKPLAIGYKNLNYIFRIYNRWGEEI